MNWDAMGAVAELAGALAVIATLVYLSLQIRQNSEIAKADLYQKAQTVFSSWRNMVAANPHVMSKMAEPGSLSAEEMVIARSIAGELAFAFAMLYENYKIISPEKLDNSVKGFLSFFTAYPAFYAGTKEQLLLNGFDEFITIVDQRREQGGT